MQTLEIRLQQKRCIMIFCMIIPTGLKQLFSIISNHLLPHDPLWVTLLGQNESLTFFVLEKFSILFNFNRTYATFKNNAMTLESVLEQNNWVSTGIKFEIPAKFHQKLVFFQLFWLKIHIFSSHTMNFDIKFQPHENVIFRFSILLLLLISLPNWIMVRHSPNGQSASVISPPPNP